jgi:hypothetical protein
VSDLTLFGRPDNAQGSDPARNAVGASRLFAVTTFDDFAATTKSESSHSIESLATAVRTTTAPTKDRLPWLKLARFGDRRSDKNCLRHDANVLAISGVEGDYDAEKVSFEEVVETARKADLHCIIYTSPSYTDDTPRWRVRCPLSEELPPGRREGLMGRLNGLFGGIFSGESWTLSQSYYYGSVRKSPSHCVEVIEGTPIDLLHELDQV